MGNYVYALRAPSIARKCDVLTSNNEKVTIVIGQMKYVCKPGRYSAETREDNITLKRMRNKWSNDLKVSDPKYVTYANIADNPIKVGDEVFGFKSPYGEMPNVPLCYNDGDEYFKTFPYGNVIKVYRKGE